ncbi:hypothetical protein A7X12_23530 [Sphingomonas sp. TDK1]|nr:hypothetical protein A7X12_23530 [Sphingomonas sp. TDK1]
MIPAKASGTGQNLHRTTNAEMTAIFTADQAARDNPAKIDWEALDRADKERRARTQFLIEKGALDSGDDFYHAAYVFQHGDDPADFLKAHALAIVAVARGKSEATWIAAATLDRYLQNIGQPQIYGTQFRHPPKQKWTQEPYRRDLLPDAVRKASGVPPLEEQDKQREDWEKALP